MNDATSRKPRGIARVWTAPRNRISGQHANALILEPGNWATYDPFLMMAEDWFHKGSFGVHPHRGIETVTYVISGKLEHFDSKGGKDVLEAGDVQWMTAGRGVVHLEDPAEGVEVHSLQLWINLPKEEKMTEPRYQNLRAANVPVREEDGVRILVFSGSSGGVKAGTMNHVPVTMVEIQLEKGASVTQHLPANYNGFFYVLEGQGAFGADKTPGGQGEALLLDRADERPDAPESEVTITAHEPMRALLYAGRPLHEPVVAHGPFVMNTREQIVQAFEDYQNGKFA